MDLWITDSQLSTITSVKFVVVCYLFTRHGIYIDTNIHLSLTTWSDVGRKFTGTVAPCERDGGYADLCDIEVIY